MGGEGFRDEGIYGTKKGFNAEDLCGQNTVMMEDFVISRCHLGIFFRSQCHMLWMREVRR